MFAFLRKTKADRFVPGVEALSGIDVDRLAKDLRLKEQGARLGARDLPKSDQAGRDSVEHEIIAAVARRRSAGIARHAEHVDVYGERLRGAHDSRVAIEAAATSGEINLDATIRDQDARLSSVREAARKNGVAFKRFVEHHGLEGIPRSGTGWRDFFLIAVIFFMAESAGNAVLFGEASSQGLLGGFFIAGMVSLLNVSSSFFAARLSRNILHRSWPRKLLGLISLLVFGAGVLLVNFGAAHFRDAAVGADDIEVAARLGLASLTAAPFDLDSLKSWGLVGIGLVIAGFVAAKTLAIDDPYPGFSAKWDAVVASRRAYSKELAAACDEIEDAVDTRIAELREESERARSLIDGVLDGSNRAGAMSSQLIAFLADCDRAASRMLAIYRDANVEKRNTPAPQEFGAPYAFEAYEPAAVDAKAIGQAHEDRLAIQSLFNAAQTRIREAGHGALAQFRSVETLENETLASLADQDAARIAPTRGGQPADPKIAPLFGPAPSGSAGEDLLRSQGKR